MFSSFFPFLSGWRGWAGYLVAIWVWSFGVSENYSCQFIVKMTVYYVGMTQRSALNKTFSSFSLAFFSGLRGYVAFEWSPLVFQNDSKVCIEQEFFPLFLTFFPGWRGWVTFVILFEWSPLVFQDSTVASIGIVRPRLYYIWRSACYKNRSLFAPLFYWFKEVGWVPCCLLNEVLWCFRKITVASQNIPL